MDLPIPLKWNQIIPTLKKGLFFSQFRTFNTAAECLFAMINGDEIYSTFTKLREKNYLVWLFSGLYVYTFIPLFTYMVLSLFIAIITETYETIKVCLPVKNALLLIKQLLNAVTGVIWFPHNHIFYYVLLSFSIIRRMEQQFQSCRLS